MAHVTPKRRIFISYAKEDWSVANQLYTDLLAAGLHPWLDEHDLLPGDNWARKVELEISQCAYFVALLSHKSVTKEGYVQNEMRQAINRALRIPEGTPFIIPVRLDDCEPLFSEFRGIHRIDLFKDYDSCLSKLIRVFEYEEKERPAAHIEDITPAARSVTRIRESGFAFIRSAYQGKDLFFHSNELVDISFDELREGDMLTYDIAIGPKGPIAVNVRRA
jgi:cold shock CspA family protein